ncbi:hypothetical protein Tco_0867711 [Tanacetum coccineum]
MMEEILKKFMTKSSKRHEEHSNLIREIRTSTDAAIINQGDSIKALEIQIGQMSKVLQERGFGGLPSSIETNPRDHVKSILITEEVDTTSLHRIGPNPLRRLRERMELELEARLMGEALILNRSHDPYFRDFLKLNYLNESLELRNHKIKDLEPTVEEGEVIDEPMSE